MGIILGLLISAGIVGGLGMHMNASKNNKAAKEIFDRHSDEIEWANNKLNQAKQSFNWQIEMLGSSKKEILEKQFLEYIELMRCFKSVEYDKKDNLCNYDKIKQQINTVVVSVENPNYKHYFPECTALAALGAYGVTSICYMVANHLTLTACFGATGASSVLAFAGGSLGVATALGGGLALGGIALGGGLFLSGLISQSVSKNNLEKAIEFERNLPMFLAQNDRNCQILDSMTSFVYNWNNSLKELSESHLEVLKEMKQVVDNNSDHFMNAVRGVFGLRPKINYKKLTKEEKYKIYKCKELSNVLYEVLSYDVFDSSGNVEVANYRKLECCNRKLLCD